MKPERRDLAAPPPDAADATDTTLRAALRALPPADMQAVDELGARVMAQWQERHAGAVTADRQAGATRVAPRWQRRLWVGSAGLAAAAAVVTAVLVMQPDPSIEELMKPDVLSQMAIGEM